MAQLRIGDSERDAAVAALGEHYAAGRLTKQEFDERADRAAAARFNADLAPLFADLPDGRRAAARQGSEAPATARQASGCVRWQDGRALGWVAPLALAMLVALLILPGMLWFLSLLFLCWLLAGFGGWQRRRHPGRRPQWASVRTGTGRAYVYRGPRKSGNPPSRGADWM